MLRDLLMPVAMRFVKPERVGRQFDHRIDWAAPVDVAPVDAAR